MLLSICGSHFSYQKALVFTATVAAISLLVSAIAAIVLLTPIIAISGLPMICVAVITGIIGVISAVASVILCLKKRKIENLLQRFTEALGQEQPRIDNLGLAQNISAFLVDIHTALVLLTQNKPINTTYPAAEGNGDIRIQDTLLGLNTPESLSIPGRIRLANQNLASIVEEIQLWAKDLNLR